MFGRISSVIERYVGEAWSSATAGVTGFQPLPLVTITGPVIVRRTRHAMDSYRTLGSDSSIADWNNSRPPLKRADCCDVYGALYGVSGCGNAALCTVL